MPRNSSGCAAIGATTWRAAAFSACGDRSQQNNGDPVTYPKHTAIDRHYHDCDEYWIILEGAGEVVVDDGTPMSMWATACASAPAITTISH